jgi:tetratricopeptide (TPR) repeat protein
LLTWIFALLAGSIWTGALVYHVLGARRENRRGREKKAAKLSADFVHSDRDLARIVEIYPTSKLAAIRYVEWAENRKDWDEALRRWAAMTERFPNDPTGFIRWGGALRRAGRFDDADTMLLKAQRQFPNCVEVYTAMAWVAQGRKDWPEEARRWAVVRDRNPLEIAAYTHGAAALRRAGRPDDASAVLDEARMRFPESPVIKSSIAG